jgi:hypothetical protein
MLWVVMGSIALAIGVTVSLLFISQLEAISNAELAGILLSVASITIAIYIAVLQIKQTDKMDKIIRKTKKREDNRKKMYLPRILSYTQIIRKHFDTLNTFIAKYEKDPKLENWQIVTNHSKFAHDQTYQLGKVVIDDFSHIYDIIDNPFVYYKYDDVIVYLSQFTFAYAIGLNPEAVKGRLFRM